ncbi:MAG: pyruvate kinase [Deltaproteobacteria bacterium]|nr:pyruvate kinase [Deltaproteobacteria bacterium]
MSVSNKLPDHKTKIVCTIGPASRSPSVIKELIRQGMNVARLNFAHGTLEKHREDIRLIRSLSKKMNKVCPILVDLPGPKIRIGKLFTDPMILKKGERITLVTTGPINEPSRIPVDYKKLPENVSKGGTIYLNDGFIQLRVVEVTDQEVVCKVVMGGPLLSHKGLNLPKAKTLADPVTEEDLDFVDFGLKEGLDLFSLSFVERADDLIKVREFAAKRGKGIHLIAKIERGEAVKNIESILKVADGIMIARGDLGVEIPIENVPAVQKRLIYQSNLQGRPVITATQMLESMTENIRPTRAEVTDVANAILDGSDAVMLSEETAIGRFPVETVRMMVRIAKSIEQQRHTLNSVSQAYEHLKTEIGRKKISVSNAISLNVMEALRVLKTKLILTPTHTGTTPRRISRFKPDCWVLAFCPDQPTRDFLSLSYGVFPIILEGRDPFQYDHLLAFIKEQRLAKKGDRLILTEMAAPGQVGGINSLNFITLT